MTSPTGVETRSPVTYRMLVGLCLLLGILARLYGAWAGRYISNPDCGIVALMARHVADGGPWPVFFYGQAYMGSLEPLVSALLCRLFGTSGFVVCLGTAVVATATLPVIYTWGRDIGGRTGGLAALALSIIGPYYAFMFQFAPRGGYMVMLLTALIVMRMSAHAACDLHHGKPVRGYRFLLIGLLAGLGWWTNFLIVSALVASAGVLVLGMRRHMFSRLTLLGLAGFFLGSLPFWLWNASHGWGSFDMFFSPASTSMTDGAGYLVQRYDRLIQLTTWPAALRGLVLWAYPLLTLAGLVIGLARLRPRRVTAGDTGILTLGLFLACSLIVFMRSSFATMNTARYLVPLAPAAAILMAYLLAMLPGRVKPWLASAVVLLLLATQVPALRDLGIQSERSTRYAKQTEQLSTHLDTQHVEALYSHFRYHALNFELDEQVVVTGLQGDRLPQYARAGELTDAIGVLGDYGRIGLFLESSGAEATLTRAGGYALTQDLKAPTNGLRELVPRDGWHIEDHTGRDCTTELLDRNLCTAWTGMTAPRDAETLTLSFDEPVTVRQLRLLGDGMYSFPRNLEVAVQTGTNAPWTVVHAAAPVTGYHWSGPRPYWWGRRHRSAYAMGDRAITALRLHAPADPHPGTLWHLLECQIFGPAPAPAAPTEALPDLLAHLRLIGADHVLADRWESNRIHVESDGSMQVELDGHAFPHHAGPLDKGGVAWGDTAIVVQRHDADLTRRMLEAAGGIPVWNNIGPWTVLQSHAWRTGQTNASALAWTGFNLMLCDPGTPQRQIGAAFGDGLELAGIRVEPTTAQPGDAIRVTFTWHRDADEAMDPHLWVFVHFRNGDSMFQDDHPLPAMPMAITPPGGGDSTPGAVVRDVRIPRDAPVGSWSIHVGLYNPRYGRRRRPQTDLPTDNHAVVVTDVLTLTATKPVP